MKELYYARVDRRDFGDLLSPDGLSRLKTDRAFEYGAVQAPLGDAVVAVWSEHPRETGQLPHLLICQDGTDGDWAAWITTFAARFRPFSAYMRLLPDSNFKETLRETRTPVLGHLLWPMAGLVLGEVLAASRLPDRALETLAASAFASTLSFAMFRATAAYSEFGQWASLVKAWESVRQLTKQRPRPIESASVASVCATVINAGGFRGAEDLLERSDMHAREACKDLIDSPERAPSYLFRLRHFRTAEEMMHGAREGRVVAFEEFVSRVNDSPADTRELTSLALGYLASRIAPGTIRHSGVLERVAQQYPTAALWYGFCAGLGGAELDIASMVSRRSIDLPASARRVARDILRPESPLEVPSCDIGFSELVALSRTTAEPLECLITTTQGVAVVELAPSISMVVNVSSKALPETQASTPRERSIIAELGREIERLNRTFKELTSKEGMALESEQPSLFQTRRKKR